MRLLNLQEKQEERDAMKDLTWHVLGDVCKSPSKYKNYRRSRSEELQACGIYQSRKVLRSDCIASPYSSGNHGAGNDF